MSGVLALTGVTGKKSGSSLIELIGGDPAPVRALFPRGIRVLCRESSRTERVEALLPGTEIRRGSFSDAAFLTGALSGADTLLHIAGIHSSREVVSAAAAAGVRRLILVHTTGIYSKYKAAGEEYRRTDEFVRDLCRERGIVLTVLRPTMIYGNVYDNNVSVFIKMVDKLPVMPVVNGARYGLQPVHYQDLAKGYLGALLHEETTANRDFILSGERPILLRDMLTEIGKNLGKDVKFISCPFPLAYAGAWGLWLVSFGHADYREKVQRLCEPRVFSHQEAYEAFGFSPRPFAQGIAGEVRQYKGGGPA